MCKKQQIRKLNIIFKVNPPKPWTEFKVSVGQSTLVYLIIHVHK